MPTWIIYYDDESTFSSDDGPPDKAPKEGVQVISNAHQATGKLLWHSAEAYCWHVEGEWVPHSEIGLRRYLTMSEQGKEPGIYILGYTIPYFRFQKIYTAAVDDPRLPFKTGNDPRERDAPLE